METTTRIATEALLRRFTHLQMASDEISWVTRSGHRWIEAVPVRALR